MSTGAGKESSPIPEATVSHSFGWNVAAACITPLYNLLVTANEILLTIDLPYVNRNEVRLTCPTDDCVEVYAKTTRKITFQDLGLRHRSGEFNCYHARIRIPVQVDETKIASSFKRGILEVRIPRLK